MQKQNAKKAMTKILTIVFMTIILLLLTQGSVKAEETWGGESGIISGNFLQLGNKYTGENNGIKWTAEVLKKDPAGDEIGEVSLTIEEISDGVTEIVLPNKIEGKCLSFRYAYKIVSISTSENVKNLDKIEKIKLGRYVKTIKNYSFANGTNLKTINFAQCLELNDIGYGTFWFCEKLALKEEDVNDNFKVVDGVLFSADGKELILYPAGKTDSEYVISENVERIREGAFASNNYLEKVTIPNTMKEIGAASFAACLKLKEIEFLENPSIKSISDNTFFNCTSLEKIELPKEITSIGSAAFANCTNLKVVVLSNFINKVGVDAFKDCNNNLVVYCYNCEENFIKNINANTTIIPAYILCEGINEGQDNQFDYVKINKFVEGPCREIEILSYVYGLPVQVLEEGAFCRNTNIEKIKIPNTVTRLGHVVFAGCENLKLIVLPASIENLPVQGFEGCKSLSKVVIKKGSKIGEIGNDIFKDCSENLVVYYDGLNEALLKHDAVDDIYRIDNQGPTATIEKISSDKISATIKISNIKDNDGGSGAEFFAISTSPTIEGVGANEWQEVTSQTMTKTVTNNGTWYVYIVDMVGNDKATTVNITGIDEKGPTFISDPIIDYTVNGAKLTIKVTDDGCGLAGYAITNSKDTENIKEWKVLSGASADITDYITENGTWYLHVKDTKGNITTKEIKIDGIDHMPPKVGNISTDNNGKEAIVSIEVSDDKSGLDAYAIDLNERNSDSTKWIKIGEIPDPLNHTIQTTIEANGTYYIHLKDKYGNINENATSFKIEGLTDQIAPRVEFIEKTNNKIKVRITDASSGIAEGAEISYAWGETKDTAPVNYSPVELKYEVGAKEFTVEIPCEGQGTYYLWLNIEELKDTAGNANTQGKIYSDSYTFDTVFPTLSVKANKEVVRRGETVIFTITTSEVVTKEENIEPKIEKSEQSIGCELGKLTGEGTTWELVLTAGQGDGPITIVIPKEIFKDATSNTLAEDYKIEGLTLDNTGPDLSKFKLTISKPIIKNGDETVFTFISDEVLAFVGEKKEYIKLIGEGATGTIAEITSKDDDGREWNITVIGGEGNGELKLELPEGLFTDAKGNVSKKTICEGLTIDNTPPTFTVEEPSDTTVNKDDTLGYILSFTEFVKLIGDKERTVAFGDKGNAKLKIEKVDEEGKKWEVTVADCTGEGTIVLTFPEFEDLAGNKAIYNQNKQFAITVDNTAPTVGKPSEPKIDVEKEKAEVEIEVNEENLQYLVSDKPEGITKDTEGWKDITTKPLKIEIKEPGTYYVYVKDKAGNITRTDKIVIPVICPKPVELKEIKITTAPTKTSYVVGENFSTEGMKITATYSDGNTKEITKYTVTDGNTLTKDKTTVTISYTEAGITKTVTQAITVTEAPVETKLTVSLKTESKYKMATEDSKNYIQNILPGRTIKTVKENINTNADIIEVYSGTEKKSDDKLVATGMTIKFKKGTEEKTYIIVVRGDLTGDGKVEFNDIIHMNNYRLNKVTSKNVAKLRAGDLSGDGKIEFNEIVSINRYRLQSN